MKSQKIQINLNNKNNIMVSGYLKVESFKRGKDKSRRQMTRHRNDGQKNVEIFDVLKGTLSQKTRSFFNAFFDCFCLQIARK